MTFSEILNILLGGGLIALVMSVITLKATVKKANAEADRAKAEAESVRITNTENATRILVENIVEPLKEELIETREELVATKKEMASTKRMVSRLTKAVEAANDCRHADNCPVRDKLRLDPKIGLDAVGYNANDGGYGHNGHGHKADAVGDSAGEPGGDVHIRGQPP